MRVVKYLICLYLDTTNIIYSKRWTDQKVDRYNFFQPVGGPVFSGHTLGRADNVRSLPGSSELEVKFFFCNTLYSHSSCLLPSVCMEIVANYMLGDIPQW